MYSYVFCLAESLEAASQCFSKQKSPEAESKRNKIRASCINRAKSRETVERPLPGVLSNPSNSDSEPEQREKGNEESVELYLTVSNEEISMNDSLLEFEDTLTPEQRKRTVRKKQPKKSKTKKLKEREEARKRDLIETLCKGDLEKLSKLLENHIKTSEEGESPKENGKHSFVNEVLDESGNALLHVAALNEHEEVVRFLLDNDADPCAKNKNQQTAYTCTQSKEIREMLKQFARDNPDKYNYNKVNVPNR